jgi:hypothetical protein
MSRNASHRIQHRRIGDAATLNLFFHHSFPLVGKRRLGDLISVHQSFLSGPANIVNRPPEE